jgi:hypothetical protein
VGICANETFCQAVSKSYPPFVFTVLKKARDLDLSKSTVVCGLIQQMVKQCLTNSASVLYQELASEEYSTETFVKILFEDSQFSKKYRPLETSLPIPAATATEKTIELYGKILEQLTELFVSSEEDEPSPLFRKLGQEILDYLVILVERIDAFSPEEINQSRFSKCMHAITNAFILCHRKLEKIACPENPGDSSVYEMIAGWVYQYLLALSSTRKYDKLLRNYSGPLWVSIYPYREQFAFHEEVQKRLELKILHQLQINFTQGLYPAISRPLLLLMGFFENTLNAPAKKSFQKKVFDLLKRDFLVLYQRDKKRALDKLPVGVEYDATQNALIEVGMSNLNAVLSLS